MVALCSLLSGTYYAHNYASIIGGSLVSYYINDISEQVSSPLHLFVDDCLLYRVIHTETDA